MLKDYHLLLDNAENVKFRGRVVASYDRVNKGSSFVVGSESDWGKIIRRIVLYETEAENLICYVVLDSLVGTDFPKNLVKVCADIEEVKEFLGSGLYAKEFYEQAKIPSSFINVP